MSFFRTSSISDFTRGGQTTLHYLRMIGQVFGEFGGFILLCFFLFVAGFYLFNTSYFEKVALLKWGMAWVSVHAFDPNSVLSFTLESGKVLQIKAHLLLADPYIQSLVFDNRRVVIKAILLGFGVIIGLFYLVIVFIYKTGSGLREEDLLRGNRVVDASGLRKCLRKTGRLSDLTLANIPIVKDSETSHILITGSPGSGKSIAIKSLLEQIRKRGDRAIVYSTAGEFIESFYEAENDVILNPLDARCPAWNIWQEGRIPPDFDTIAASLIQEKAGSGSTSGDPFWVLAARTLFSTVAMKMSQRQDYSTKRLLKDLLTIDLTEAAELVKGTEGAALLAEGAEKTALSVRATLAAYIRCLKFLNEESGQENMINGEPFSIRNWVEEDKGNGWIFIASRPDQEDTLKPLITLWLDIATSAILSLPTNVDRRIWIIIDELPSLNRLPSLEKLLAQSRKYGGCGVLGFQSYAQLSSIYGVKGAETIAGLCSTWMCYRSNEPGTAEWVAKSMGSGEYLEAREALSYGANTIRDGVNLNMERNTRPLVMPTELMNLPNLTGYIRLLGDYPIAKFSLKYKPYPTVAEAFMATDLSQSVWDFNASDASETVFDDKFDDKNDVGEKENDGDEKVIVEKTSDEKKKGNGKNESDCGAELMPPENNKVGQTNAKTTQCEIQFDQLD